MTAEQFADLLAELAAIKLALIMATILVAVSAVAGVIRSYRSVIQLARKELNDLFRAEALELFERGQLERLIASCQQKLLERPNHVYAHWYLGRAYYLQECWDPAVRAFEAAKRISPDWAESVDPYLETIRSKGAPH